MANLLTYLLNGGQDAETLARIARLERKLNMVMTLLDIEMPAHPAEDEVGALVETGKKIEAIKRLRELTGCGLAEGKEAVDRDGWRDLLRMSL
ncbi:MAG: hypothetical protein AAGJ54_09705 [Planctomycetota bacterium]